MSDRLRMTLVAGALLVSVAVSVAQSQNVVRGITWDFVARYAAGEMVIDGESPYDQEAHQRYTAVHGAYGVPVRDAPPVIAAFRLVTVLPLRAAAGVLTAGSYLSVGVLAWLLTQRARASSDRGLDAAPQHRWRPLIVWGLCGLALLQTSPVRVTLALGQTDLIALACVLLLVAWVPAVGLLKPQTAGLTAVALVGRAVGLRWPPSVAAIRWRNLLIGGGTSAALVAVSWVLAEPARWDDWLDRVRGRQGEYAVDWPAYVVAALGLVVIVRGVLLARRAGRPIDVVCLAGGATALLSVTAFWNPQWFLAVLIPLGAIVVPYLLGDLRLDRVQGAVLIVVCAATAGDAWVTYARVNPTYHLEVPAAALSALLFAFWLLRLVRPAPAALIVVLNLAIVHLPLSASERASVSVAAAVGTLWLLLEVRPSGLLDPAPNAA